MQAGEKLLLPCGGKEIFLLLMARQVHHPRSDVGYYDNLRKGEYDNSLTIQSFPHFYCVLYQDRMSDAPPM